MGKRHLTPQEIIRQCNIVARESRMAERAPWTAMAIMCAYVIMKKEGFKGQRILKITSKVNELEEQWENGKIDMKEISQKLMDKADFSIEAAVYTESDIRSKKGTYRYWLDSKQIAPQNTINDMAVRYMLFFFKSLMDDYGFGKERLTRVHDYMDDLLKEYQSNKTSVREWSKSLLDEAGVVIEMPIDPLTQKQGSILTC